VAASELNNLQGKTMPAIEATHPNQRRKLFTLLGAAIAAGAIGYGIYWYTVASRYVSTDNAYTSTEVAQVTPEVGGTVAKVHVVDTQQVKKGDILLEFNNIDARLALQLAEGQYASAVRRVRGIQATDSGLAAQIAARDADTLRADAQLQSSSADFERARIELQRRQALAKSGSVSGDEITLAQNAYATAQANLTAARALVKQAHANQSAATGSRNANLALIDNTTLANNPEISIARAKLDQARLDLERTVVRAPVDGVIARRQVQIGQKVTAGSMLMTVVPLAQIHVDANFKEVQLQKVRIGQQVELSADIYGDGVTYHGRVSGFAGGTGSAFSLIPAQNATGNWIKVVQRLPIRIQLDPAELARHPLQVGLSMNATIDTRTSR
jgi:membrane fusion protein (multidrug efflux system)